MSVDKWLGAVYRRGEYTCSDFTRDVWLDMTGVDIGPALDGLLEAHDGRGLRREHVRSFKALSAPISPCIVVLQRPRFPVHLGVYIRGRILQITEHGVSFLSVPAATQFHKTHRFVTCTP